MAAVRKKKHTKLNNETVPHLVSYLATENLSLFKKCLRAYGEIRSDFYYKMELCRSWNDEMENSIYDLKEFPQKFQSENSYPSR